MNKYTIAGDNTGVTYGVYKHKEGEVPFNGELVVSGLKSFDEARKKIKELEETDLT